MSRCLGRLCGVAFGFNDALRAGQSPDWLEDILPLARSLRTGTLASKPMVAVLESGLVVAWRGIRKSGGRE